MKTSPSTVEAVGADLVDRVLNGVVVAVVGAVVEIDHIDGGDAAIDKGQMIVVHGFFGLEEVVLIAELFCGLADKIDEPAGGAGFALDVEILVADHIGQHKGLDAAQGSVAAPLGGQVPAAIRRVGRGPVFDGLFAVEEDQPHRVAIEFFAAQFVGDCHQQA